MQTFKIKRNDTQPTLAATLQYANGSAVDLTNGSVFFVMGELSTYAPYCSGLCTITNATAGTVEYAWTGSKDTSGAGKWWGEFEMQWTGSKMTLPVDHSFQIQVYEDYN